MSEEKIEEIKTPKKMGRPPRTDYDIYHPHKQKLLKGMRDYPGMHVNRILRYRIIYEGQEYKFSTLQQIMDEFDLSYSLVNKLLFIHTNKLKNNIELTNYEKKILNAYTKITVFEKIEINKKIRVVGIIKPTTDTSLNLKITVPCQ